MSSSLFPFVCSTRTCICIGVILNMLYVYVCWLHPGCRLLLLGGMELPNRVDARTGALAKESIDFLCSFSLSQPPTRTRNPSLSVAPPIHRQSKHHHLHEKMCVGSRYIYANARAHWCGVLVWGSVKKHQPIIFTLRWGGGGDFDLSSSGRWPGFSIVYRLFFPAVLFSSTSRQSGFGKRVVNVMGGWGGELHKRCKASLE